MELQAPTNGGSGTDGVRASQERDRRLVGNKAISSTPLFHSCWRHRLNQQTLLALVCELERVDAGC